MRKTRFAGMLMLLWCMIGTGGLATGLVPAGENTAAPAMVPARPGNGVLASVSAAKETAGGVQEYFPVLANTRYVYEGSGNEYASYDVFVLYAQGTRMQQRVDNGGTVMARVIEVQDGAARLLYTREEAYYRENFLQREANADEVLLMEPLRAGTKWTLSDGRERRIQSVSADVSTPLGDFVAVEVVTKSEDGATTAYYARGVGLVKTVFKYGDMEISSSLSAIEEDVPFIQTVRFYRPNLDGGNLDFADVPVRFYTNDITRIALAQAYKDVLSDQPSKVLSEHTKINSLYLNRDGMAYIDLSRDFVEEMNAGSGYEALILQSVANTIGRYYGVDRVLLTIDDALYESGHIALKKGEYLIVSPDNAK